VTAPRPSGRGAVLLARAPRSGGALLGALDRLGLEPLVVDALRFGPGRDRARLAERLAAAGGAWIALTSARAARALVEAVATGAALSAGARLAALGDASAAPLRAAGLAPALVAGGPPAGTAPGEGTAPDAANAAALADAIAAAGGPRAALFLRGNRARRDLPERLARAGFAVEELEVYATDAAPFDAAPLAAALAAGRLAASIVSSPSTAEAVLARLAPPDRALWLDVPAVASGRTTAEALVSLGARRITVATAPSEEGLAAGLGAALAATRAPVGARAARDLARGADALAKGGLS
jgi:uroporphyrinogen-III synthase